MDGTANQSLRLKLRSVSRSRRMITISLSQRKKTLLLKRWLKQINLFWSIINSNIRFTLNKTKSCSPTLNNRRPSLNKQKYHYSTVHLNVRTTFRCMIILMSNMSWRQIVFKLHLRKESWGIKGKIKKRAEIRSIIRIKEMIIYNKPAHKSQRPDNIDNYKYDEKDVLY